jgi:hypothetical protein
VSANWAFLGISRTGESVSRFSNTDANRLDDWAVGAPGFGVVP